KIQAIAIERNGIEPPIITLAPNASGSDAQAALKIGQNVRANEQMAVVLPHDWTFEYPKMMQNRAEAILPAIQYCDVMMARAFYAQWINLGSTETGAYNLDASQKRTWLMALQAVADYISDTITSAAIRPLVNYNFGEQAVYPKLCCAKLLAQDLTT